MAANRPGSRHPPMMQSGGRGASLVLEGVARVHDMLDCPREDWRCAGKAAMLVLWRRQIHPIPRGRPGRGICPSR